MLAARFVEQTQQRLSDDAARSMPLHRPDSAPSNGLRVGVGLGFKVDKGCSSSLVGGRPGSASGERQASGALMGIEPDSASKERRLNSACSPVPPSTCSDETVLPSSITKYKSMEHMEQWRQMFVKECQDSIRVMRSVVDGANVRCCAQEFGERRTNDSQMTGQMQRHLEELINLHQSLRKFQLDYLTTDEFGQFRTAMTQLKASVDSLEEGRKQHFQLFQAVAEKTADRAASMVSSQWISATEVWNPFLKGTEERRTSEDDRWARMEKHFEQIQSKLDSLDAAVKKKDMEQGLQKLPALVAENLDSVLREMMRDMNGITQKIVGHACDDLRSTFTGDSQKLTTMLSEYFEDNSRIVKPIETSVKAMDARLSEVTHALRNEANLKEESDKVQKGIEQMRCQLEESNEAVKSTGLEKARLEKNTIKLEKAMEAVNNSLADAKTAVAAQALRRLKDVEGRGHVRLNLGTGNIEFVRPLAFVPNKPASGQALGDLRSPEDAQPVLSDIAELMGLFRVPVMLEVSTKAPKADPRSGNKEPQGSPAFWEAVANARCEVLVEELIRHGIGRDLLLPKGAFKKNANSDGLVVRLDAVDIFPGQKNVQNLGQKDGGRGNSSSARSISPSRGR